MHNYLLNFNIKSDWHIGSGKEGGAYADALCLKNNEGLPYLPGKSCKGLLRDAFETAQNAGWIEQNMVDLLFGVENREGIQQQGMLQIFNAQLCEQESHYIVSKKATKHLYRVVQYTAIDELTGTAKQSSLRSLEVTVPMLLTAEIRINIDHPAYLENSNRVQIDEKFAQWLTSAISLISELGAKRHRGLGKVTVSAKEA